MMAAETMLTRTASSRSAPRPLVRLLAGAAWLAMLAAHAPLWLRACWPLLTGEGSVDWVRVVLVTLTQSIFILKLVDVPWLRLPRDRRVWLAVAVGVALLHAGVIDHATPLLNEALGWHGLLVVSGLAALTVAARRGRGARLDGVHARAIRLFTRTCLARAFDVVRQTLLPPRFLLLTLPTLVDRAPPRTPLGLS